MKRRSRSDIRSIQILGRKTFNWIMKSKAVFLDKDGTLTKNIPFNADPALIRLSDGAIDALRLLQHLGFQLIVVTNQSGVARGYFPERMLQNVEKRLCEMLESEGIVLKGFYYCPHLPQGKVSEYAIPCFCRKPQPGMIYRAAREHNLDLSASWMIGDILHDVAAGNRAGCRTVLIKNHETEGDSSPGRIPSFAVSNLMAAAKVIAGVNVLERDVSHDW